MHILVQVYSKFANGPLVIKQLECQSFSESLMLSMKATVKECQTSLLICMHIPVLTRYVYAWLMQYYKATLFEINDTMS